MYKYEDFFELINNDDPVAAVFMTYGFDTELFEHHILPSFLGIVDDPKENILRFRNQIAMGLKEVPVAVLSDNTQYNGGSTFLYDHYTIKTQTFHPKCYMVLFKNFLRVIISSGNISRGGLCFNAETIWHEDIYPHKSSTISKELIDILNWIINNYGLENIEALNEIRRYLINIDYIEGFPKLNSTVRNNSVYSQVFDEINKINHKCKSLTIVSPFFENDRDRAMENALLVSFYEKFNKKFPGTPFSIYFPGIYEDSTKCYKVEAPKNIFEGLVNKYKNINLYIMANEWAINDGKELAKRKLHAKLIIIRFNSGYELRLSGSINFTNNAMRSNLSSLRNIEIGVMEYLKSNFKFPSGTKVNIKKLKFLEKPIQKDIIPCFIENVIFDGIDLYISFDVNKMIVPFIIKYNGNLIKEIKGKITEIIIKDFVLRKPQDLEIIGDNFIYFVPIMIPNKENIQTEDEKFDFEMDTKDIIDYLAGRYKSISELGRSRRNANGSTPSVNTLYFRQNLQRYYKAMANLKQGLENQYYSELSFKNHVNNPLGLKNLANLILSDYRDKNSSTEETSLFIIEILNVIQNLEFKKDRVDSKLKIEVLQEVTNDLKMEFKKIYKRSKGKFKKQCKIMIEHYGLDV